MKIVNRTQVPDAAVFPLIQWVLAHMDEKARGCNILLMQKARWKGIGGIANQMGFGRGRVSRGLPQAEPLVTIQIGARWEEIKYPKTETYKERAGSMTYYNWREHFVALLAHELRHIEQYATIESKEARKQRYGSLEVDAERHAQKILALYQKHPVETIEKAAKPKMKDCPRCNKSGPIDTMFGYRTIKGDKVIPQSYCIECRRAHAQERRGY